MTGQFPAGVAQSVRHLAVLRGFTMIGYTMSYVVIPTLVFEKTRSATAAGLALIAEGLLRSLLALVAGRMRSAVGTANVVHTAEGFKLCALALLGFSLLHFSLVTVVMASFLYQLGYSLSLLEMELRCGALGADAPRCQALFRVAEMLAVPPVLVTAVLGQRHGIGLETLVAAAAVASIVHHRLWHRWQRPMDAGTVLGWGALAEAARHLAGNKAMRGGLVASVIGYGFFSWALLATPFVFDGRHVFGLALTSAGGGAAFKALVVATCLACTLAWTRVFASAWTDRIMLVVSVATPAVFLFALRAGGDAAAVAAGCAAVAMTTGLSSWQRAWRQRHAPERVRSGITTLYLSAECLGMVCAGAALLLNAPLLACAAAAALMAWGLRHFWAAPSPAPSEAVLGTSNRD